MDSSSYTEQRRVQYLKVTSRYFLHEDLDEAVLTDGAEVLNNVPVFEPLVQSDFLVKGLRVPGKDKTCVLQGQRHNILQLLQCWTNQFDSGQKS